MKRRSLLGIAGAVAATLVITGSAFAASAGVTNGGFEAGTLSDAGHPGYQELPAGSNELGPWSITSGSVDWISTYWAPASGTKSIDLAGREPGAISQTISTTPYQTYTVTFKLAGNTDSANNPAGGPTVKTALRRGRRADRQLLVRHDRQDAGRHGLDDEGLHVQGDRRQHDHHVHEHERRLLRRGARRHPGGRARRLELQEQRLEVDDRQRRPSLQEPGRLRQLLRHRREEPRRGLIHSEHLTPRHTAPARELASRGFVRPPHPQRRLTPRPERGHHSVLNATIGTRPSPTSTREPGRL